MKKWYLVALACFLVLAGCRHFYSGDVRPGPEGFDPKFVRQPHPLYPKVFILETERLADKLPIRRILLDQSPIRITKDHVGPDGRVTITWALPAGSPYTFAENGVQLKPVPTSEGARTRDMPVRCDKGAAYQTPLHYYEITAVELRELKTSQPEALSCPTTKETGNKVFSCSYTAPKGPTIYKYSVYVCNGKELLQPYDPFVVNDI